MGVSLRRLNGWEPAETTSYEYDADGRLLRTVTVREAEWTRDEVALFIASRRVEADMGPHGIPWSRAVDPDAKFMADPVPTLNKAVDAVARAEDAYHKKWPNAPKRGLVWRVREVK